MPEVSSTGRVLLSTEVCRLHHSLGALLVHFRVYHFLSQELETSWRCSDAFHASIGLILTQAMEIRWVPSAVSIIMERYMRC